MAKKKQKKQQTGQQYLSPEQYMKQRARSLEIGTCYVSADMTECGEGNVIVTRKHTGGRVSMAMYLVDIFCIGVKDSIFRLRMEPEELEDMLDYSPDLRECSYDEAHNWVYGALAWAEEAGIKPHKSFAVTQYMLEEDNDDIPLIEYEFGHNGMHLLMANSNLEASRYLPLLRNNLGEGNYEFTIKDDFDRKAEANWDIDETLERLKNADESPLFKKYGPDTEYTYQHPAYPSTMQTDGPEWLYQELQSTENAVSLPDDLTDRILALPRETLRHDLEQIILYHIGLTCDDIPDDYDPDGYTGLLSNCIMLLGEVGNEDSSLDTVLEVLRQSNDFFTYHFGDAGHEIFVPTLYLLGQNRLDKLMSYMKEEGLDTFCKCHVFDAVAQVALAQPERRSEVIAWYREMLVFATKMLPQTQWIDSDLAGLMLHGLLDIQAKELLHEIRAMFATNLVDLSACGDIADVTRMIANPRYAGKASDCITEIHERFADMKRRWGE